MSEYHWEIDYVPSGHPGATQTGNARRERAQAEGLQNSQPDLLKIGRRDWLGEAYAAVASRALARKTL